MDGETEGQEREAEGVERESASGDASHNASHDVSHRWRTVEEAQGLVDGQWIVGRWSGLERLECLYCQWDTLEGLEAARAHRLTCSRCGGPATANEHVVLVADRRGREVQNSGSGELTD